MVMVKEVREVLWRKVDLATMTDGWGAVRNGALLVRGDRIAWLGRDEDLPPGIAGPGAVERRGEGRWLTPALIDCHTHLVFAGDRADEFERRLGGERYEEIARSGGGILSTVRATREASEEDLFELGARRLARLTAEGVGVVEIKSGYGLSTESELRLLRVGRRLGRETEVRVVNTFLGAHALPPEFTGDRNGYLELVRHEMLPRIAEEGVAEAVDAFCDNVAFTPEECAAVLRAGVHRGLDVRLHADQLSDQGGAILAAKLRARSADHLEYTSEAGVRAMADAGVVAVLLPGAYHFLGGERIPPLEAFRSLGVDLAVATDLNPGSSPVTSLLLALNLGCVHFGLTPLEAVRGATVHAARVVGLHELLGTLERGKEARLALWEVNHPRELPYWAGGNPCSGLFFPPGDEA